MRIFLLLTFGFIFAASQSFSQSTITGKILDAKTKEPLIGATVLIKGTSTAASASLNGSFKIIIPSPGTGTLVFTYIGYTPKEVAVSESKNLGSVLLESAAGALNEVIINAPVIDRKTPIAVSTVNAEFIEEKGAGQEFPELLKETPGIMATRTGGGYGDSRVSIRGFSSNNVALLINGIPVNDVESGKIYWSDWAGLADVSTSLQVQRGLGASKVAAPSLGGTIAITTLSTNANAGGSILESVGSYNDNKMAVSLSSGLSNKGWASSFLLAKRTGDGNAEGLYYTGYSYFFNLSKVLTKSQTLSFNILGASQTHGQRYTYNTIPTYEYAPQGIRFDSDYGYLNGKLTSAEVNFYNKPLAALNYNFHINESTDFAAVGYGSWGSGGAIYSNTAPTSLPRTGAPVYSPIDFNAIVKNNLANGDGSSSTYLQNSGNDHQQYGVLGTLKKKFGESIGLDLRYYEGQHYYQLNDLLGGQYIYDNNDVNNPHHRVLLGDRFNNNYQFDIASEGLFLQTEYSKNDLSAFVSVAGNTTGNKRIDYFNYLITDPNRASRYVNFLGYQAKGGANYNLDSHDNVFFNIGYLQRPPLVASVFLNKNNTINPNAVPEKLFSYEAGYGFRSSELTANINLYHSTYKDRSVTPRSITNSDGSISTVNLSGLNELHEGVEFDARYKPSRDITFRGMLSVGKWYYLSDAGPAQVTNDKGSSTTISQLYIKGLNVGDAAQTTASFAFDWFITPKLKAGPVYNYYANYTAYFAPTNITSAGYVPYKVPNYSLFDLNAVFYFKIAGLDGSFIGNVNNLFNVAYISDAYDQNGTAYTPAQNTSSTIGVFYGIGRTYTTTLKIKF
jgi:outer membrane receptor protein involved in Fe transport